MNRNAERIGRPHVVRRFEEIQDPNYCSGQLFRSSVEERVTRFRDYAKHYDKHPEPETRSDKDLLEDLECFCLDSSRYSSWTSEHNFAIMALACEWFFDVRDEILRRMKKTK